MENIVKCEDCEKPLTDESKCQCDSNSCKDCCECEDSESKNSQCGCGHDCGCR